MARRRPPPKPAKPQGDPDVVTAFVIDPDGTSRTVTVTRDKGES